MTTDPLPDDLLAKATPFLTDEQLAELERQLIASEKEWQQYEGRGFHPAHDLLAFKAEEYIRRLLTDVRALHAAINAYTGREREDTRRPIEPTPQALEAAARAYDPVGWDWYDKAYAEHPAKPVFHERAFAQMRAALAATPARAALDEAVKTLQEIATLDQAVVIQGEHEFDVTVVFDRGALKHAEKTAEMARRTLDRIAELTTLLELDSTMRKSP